MLRSFKVKLDWRDISAGFIGVASAGLLYILFAFEDVRINAVNDAAISGAYAINLIGFCIAFMLQSKRLLWINAVLLLLLIGASFIGAADCFCIGGGCSPRISNCSANHLPFVGLLNAVFIALDGRRMLAFVVASMFIALPVIAEIARLKQVSPLQASLEKRDLQSDCVVSIAEFWFDMPVDTMRATRLRDNSMIEVGWFAGEGAPRYMLLDAEGVHIWRYADQSFQTIETLPSEAIVSRLRNLCGEGNLQAN